jgi:hypothetical protein
VRVDGVLDMMDESRRIGGVLAKRRNWPMKGPIWARGINITLLSSHYPIHHPLTALTAITIGTRTIALVSCSVHDFGQPITEAHPCAALGGHVSLEDRGPAATRTRFNTASQPLCGCSDGSQKCQGAASTPLHLFPA